MHACFTKPTILPHIAPICNTIMIEMYKQGVTQNEIARLFSVNRSTVCGIASRFTSTGNIGKPQLSAKFEVVAEILK